MSDPAAPPSPSAASSPSPGPVGLRRLDLEAGGLRWRLRCAGDGPPVLLLHGTGASGHSWEPLIPRLAVRHTVWAPDLPGQGGTVALRGDGSSSLPGMAAALQALLTVLGPPPVLVIGHSAGAAVAARWLLDGARSGPPLLSVNGAFVPWRGWAGACFQPAARLLARQRWLPALVSRSARDEGAVARLVAGTGSRLKPEGVAAYAALMREPGHVAGTLAMMAAWDLPGLWSALPALRAPVWLLAASGDRTIPPGQADEVAARLRHGRVLRLAGCGHLAHEEAPAVIDRLAAALWRDPGAPPPPGWDQLR